MKALVADQEKTPTVRQRHNKNISEVTNNHAVKEKFLKAVKPLAD
jgi:hypothetical protein